MNSILELEGVKKLSRNQMKTVGGGGYLTNFQCTGNFYHNTSVDGPTGYECTASYQRTFLGFNWGSPQELASGQTFPCPAGMSC